MVRIGQLGSFPCGRVKVKIRRYRHIRSSLSAAKIKLMLT